MRHIAVIATLGLAAACSSPLPAQVPATLSESRPLPPDSEYVSVVNGHLSRNGRRLRLWGAIGGFPGRHKRDAEAAVKRLKDLGFNAVRYWGVSELNNTYQPGDGSRSDIYDYFLTLLRREDMYVWLPSIVDGTAKVEDVNILNDAATAQARQEAVGQGISLRGNPAVVWDARLRALAMQRIRAVANHVNKHNGLRLADDPTIAVWELTNEQWWFGHMVSGDFQRLPQFFQRELIVQWNDFLLKKYGTEAGLKTAWAELLSGEALANKSVLLLPLRSNTDAGGMTKALAVQIKEGISQRYTADDFKTQRGRDVIEFLLQIWLVSKQEQQALTKTLGKSMKSAPLVFDTGIGYEIQAQYIQQQADAVAHDTYITAFQHDPKSRRFPWFSGLEEQPRLYWDVPWVEHNRVEGKPYLIYETQIEQPAKYRAEYPMRIAALGAIQDWNAVCWHYFGGVPDAAQPKPYERAMDYTLAHAGAHPQGHHYQFDEVQLSAMKAAAEIFKNGHIQAAPNPTRFIFGRKSLTDPRSMDYGKSYGELGLRMSPTTYRYGVRLQIDPTREDDAVIGPTVRPRIYESDLIRPNDQIEYDIKRGHLKMDAPGAVSYYRLFCAARRAGSFQTRRDVARCEH